MAPVAPPKPRRGVQRRPHTCAAVLLCVLWFALGKRTRDRYLFKRSAPTSSGWSASDEAMLAA